MTRLKNILVITIETACILGLIGIYVLGVAKCADEVPSRPAVCQCST